MTPYLNTLNRLISIYTLSQYINKHTRSLPKTKKIVGSQSDSNTKKPKHRQPIRIEHHYAEKTAQELSASLEDPSQLSAPLDTL